MSNGVDTNFKDIMPCDQEETNTRLHPHVFDACKIDAAVFSSCFYH